MNTRYQVVSAGMVLALWCAGSALAVDLYVSPEGDDTHPGTLQKPWATLEKARDWIRRHKDSRPVTVHLRAGTYLFREPLTFAAEDSGTLGVPDVVIATTNVGHLSRFVRAELWQQIPSA